MGRIAGRMGCEGTWSSLVASSARGHCDLGVAHALERSRFAGLRQDQRAIMFVQVSEAWDLPVMLLRARATNQTSDFASGVGPLPFAGRAQRSGCTAHPSRCR